MRFTVVTIFPEMFESLLASSLLGKAREASTIAVDFVDPRDFTRDRHRSVDDAPYGGGPGMVMKVEPLVAAIESAAGRSAATARRVLLTPAGRPLTQALVRELAASGDHLVLVCGRYEGIDERVAELAIDEQVSLGDFVMTGGEIAAMAIIDAVSRYVPGVLGESASTEEESFSEARLEYPQYTRPHSFRGADVPEVLTSGNHARIRDWRRQQALARTAERRPDLLAREVAAKTHVALVHHPVLDREGAVVTTSITNLDLHDIARSTATYGVAGYHVVTPVTAQREKVDRILSVWTAKEQAAGEEAGDGRAEALRAARTAATVAEVAAAIAAEAGVPPRVVLTSARRGRFPDLEALSAAALVARAGGEERPVLVCLGTGWGLADELVSLADWALTPIRGAAPFNHLSVRSAAAVLLDRLFGDA